MKRRTRIELYKHRKIYKHRRIRRGRRKPYIKNIYIFWKGQKTKRQRCFWEAIKNFRSTNFRHITNMRRKNNYVMRKLDTPKRITLPNGRNFYGKYKRVKRSELRPNIILRRNYWQRAAPRVRRRRRVAQQGRGTFSTLKKIAKNPIVRKLAKTGLSYAPQVYNYGVSKINNKTAKKILGSDTNKNLFNNLAFNREWVVIVLVILT